MRIFVVSLIVLLWPSNGAWAADPIRAVGDLPGAVARLYEATCTRDSWIGGKRRLEGSATDTFSDGTKAYLLVCGDAASVTPFTIIVQTPDGAVAEGKLLWRLRGRTVEDAGLSNARFGRADTIESRSHSSGSCEPRYSHRWNGMAFELVHLDRKGCQKDE